MIEEVSYGGWPRCLRMSHGNIELIITLDVGPRIIRFGFTGGPNVFKEFPEQMGKSGEEKWVIRGGHRFWTAPENDESYALDNSPVSYEIIGPDSVEIMQPEQEVFGWQRFLLVSFSTEGVVTVTHRLVNLSDNPIEVTPWALSVMAPGGSAFIPQPEWRPHPTEAPEGSPLNPDDFLPNRQFVLWKYTEIADPRFTFGRDLWVVRHDANRGATKFGLRYAGWVAYQLDDVVFAKRIPLYTGAQYPDQNVNFELFANREILELESLAPGDPIPGGAEREHTEVWTLRSYKHDLSDPATAATFFGSLSAYR